MTIPETTEVYDAAAIDSVEPGSSEHETVAVIEAGEPVPDVGGHAALAPSPGLPYGMLARVVAVTDAGAGQHAVTLETAAIDEVFDDVNYSFDGPVTPILVDENGDPVPGSRGPSGELVIRGEARRSGDPRAAPAGAFDCKETGGIPRDQEQVWTTGLPLPIEIKLENTHVLHTFDAGSLFPSRAPSLLLQFSGEAVATIGVQAKTGFECELTDAFRRNHRIQLPIRNIGPVPISIFLEPVLKFGVSAAGEISISQRHFFAYTLEKRGSDALSFRRASSSATPQFTASARLGAALFAGGDLSLLVGAAGSSTNVGAGIYGAFGPEFALSTEAAQPGCINASVHLKADFGVRLQLWTKRWNLEVGSLTGPDTDFPGSPFCGLPVPPPPPPPLPPPPPPTGHATGVSAGVGYSCLTIDTGAVACWGANGGGQLGDGSATASPTPVTARDVANAVSIASGGGHTCAVRSTGRVACWGANASGQLGNGTTTARSTPVAVSGLTDAISVGAANSGAGHSCAARANGRVNCWGANGSGQLGNGTNVGSSVPVAVAGITDATAVAARGSTSCARLSSGGVRCWGSNGSGQLGNGTTTSSSVPVEVSGITNATAIAASLGHSCASLSTGQVACWGGNASGELGDGTTTSSTTPVTVEGIANATSVAVGSGHSCALLSTGSVTCWGLNADGELGDGTTTNSPIPVVTSDIANAVAIAAVGTGGGTSCASLATGGVRCWGNNSSGQLGDGTFTDRSTPVVVSGFP